MAEASKRPAVAAVASKRPAAVAVASKRLGAAAVAAVVVVVAAERPTNVSSKTSFRLHGSISQGSNANRCSLGHGGSFLLSWLRLATSSQPDPGRAPTHLCAKDSTSVFPASDDCPRRRQHRRQRVLARRDRRPARPVDRAQCDRPRHSGLGIFPSEADWSAATKIAADACSGHPAVRINACTRMRRGIGRWRRYCSFGLRRPARP